jgi:hypothetical protein
VHAILWNGRETSGGITMKQVLTHKIGHGGETSVVPTTLHVTM